MEEAPGLINTAVHVAIIKLKLERFALDAVKRRGANGCQRKNIETVPKKWRQNRAAVRSWGCHPFDVVMTALPRRPIPSSMPTLVPILSQSTGLVLVNKAIRPAQGVPQWPYPTLSASSETIKTRENVDGLVKARLCTNRIRPGSVECSIECCLSRIIGPVAASPRGRRCRQGDGGGLVVGCPLHEIAAGLPNSSKPPAAQGIFSWGNQPEPAGTKISARKQRRSNLEV